jgi:hypothetical protein
MNFPAEVFELFLCFLNILKLPLKKGGVGKMNYPELKSVGILLIKVMVKWDVAWKESGLANCGFGRDISIHIVYERINTFICHG